MKDTINLILGIFSIPIVVAIALGVPYLIGYLVMFPWFNMEEAEMPMVFGVGIMTIIAAFIAYWVLLFLFYVCKNFINAFMGE